MRRFRVKAGFTIHSDKGNARGPDTFPEGWIPADHLEDLIAAGLVVEVEEEPASSPRTRTTLERDEEILELLAET